MTTEADPARMNEDPRSIRSATQTGYSACPHDCPSTCALEVAVIDGHTVGRIHGARDNSHTAGVVCAKVARHAERIGSACGQVRLHARLSAGLCRGALIAESIWPNEAFPDGRGINTLTGADAIAPHGGTAFHDNRVWIRRH